MNCDCHKNQHVITIVDHQGLQGQPGQPGQTPWIHPTTYHWIIGTTDTGICAQGQDGKTPWIRETDLHWMIGDVDTGVIAGTKEPITNGVQTYDNISLFPAVGKDNVIYIDKSTNYSYRYDKNTNQYILLAIRDGKQVVEKLQQFTNDNILIIQG